MASIGRWAQARHTIIQIPEMDYDRRRGLQTLPRPRHRIKIVYAEACCDTMISSHEAWFQIPTSVSNTLIMTTLQYDIALFFHFQLLISAMLPFSLKISLISSHIVGTLAASYFTMLQFLLHNRYLSLFLRSLIRRPDRRLSTDPPPYFNRTDVQKAINAPIGAFTICGGNNFVTADGQDNALKSIFTTLPRVFDRAPRNIVINGGLDMLIPYNGTLLSLQNTTWRGNIGFLSLPTHKLIIPPPKGNVSFSTTGASGEMGKWISERGVTFVHVNDAGHELPQFNPSAALRLLGFLPGRLDVDSGLGGGAEWSVRIGD